MGAAHHQMLDRRGQFDSLSLIGLGAKHFFIVFVAETLLTPIFLRFVAVCALFFNNCLLSKKMRVRRGNDDFERLVEKCIRLK